MTNKEVQEQILKEYAKILPAHDHYSGEHIYKERRMKLSDEEIETLFSFVKGALKRVADEAERNMMWDYHDKITSLKQYLHQLQTQIQAHPTEEPDELNLIESIKEKVDEVFDIAKL